MEIHWFEIVKNLFLNGLVVIAIGALSESILERLYSLKTRTRQLVSGLTFSLMAMTSMIMTIELFEGVIFDSRYIIIILSAILGGSVPAIITTATVIVFRFILGGSGIIQGIGASLTVMLTGLLLRRIKTRSNMKRYLLFGFASILLVGQILLWALTFPQSQKSVIVQNYLIALFLLYPILTIGLALILDVVSRRKYSTTDNQYKSLIQDLPQSIFLKDLELKYLFCNESYAKDLKVKPDKIIGKDDFHFFPTELAEKYRRDDRRILDSGKEEVLEERYKRDDEDLWVQTIKKPVYDIFGNTIGILGIFWDITDKKMSENRLLEAEKIAHLGHWEMDIKTGQSIWSDEFYKICGVSKNEIPHPDASRGFELIHPEDRKMASEILGKALESGNDYKLEKRILRPDGKIRYVDSRGIIVRDSQGDPVSMVGTFFDITELKKTQRELYNLNENLGAAIEIQTKALTESESKFRNAFNNAVHGMVIANSKGKLIEANEAFCSMLGYTQEEMQGVDFRSLTWHEDVDEDMYNLDRLLSDEIDSFEIEKRYIHKSGVLIWCNLCVTKTSQEENDRQLIGQIININDQKKNSMAMEASLSLSLMLGSSSMDDIIDHILTESENITDSRISYFHFVNPDQETIALNSWSKRTVKVCDVPGEMKHYPISQAGIWVDCFHQKKTVIHNDYKSEKNKKGLPEGHTLLLRDMAIPLFEGNSIVAIIGLGNKPSDYTDSDIERVTLLLKNGWLIIRRKRLEDQLKQARDAAEKANKIKSQFLANISHEIRTPLNSVIGFSELLSDKITDSKLLHYTNSITESGQSLLALINDILDLSKLEADKMTLQNNPIELEKTFKKVLVIFQIKAEEKGLALEFNRLSVLPKIVFSDEIRLHQIMLNLLSNALKFTSQGKVSLNVSFKTDNEGRSSGDLEISIKDTGIGIPEKEQKQIFDSFIQMSGQDNREYGGTGLGLSITSKLVQMMGGEINLSSRMGEGSIFTVIIPGLVYSNEFVESLDEEIEKQQYSKKSALIIDDNNSNREVLELNLKETGLYVYSAENGTEGLKYIHEIHPDIVFLDLQMPEMDGFEVLKIIREKYSKDELPVYAYTAATGDNPHEQFNGIVQKPVASNQLNEVLAEIFSKERKSDSKIEIFNDQVIEEISDLETDIYENLLSIVKGNDLADESGIDITLLEKTINEIMNIASSTKKQAFLNTCLTIKKMIEEFNIPGIKKEWHRLEEIMKKSMEYRNGK